MQINRFILILVQFEAECMELGVWNGRRWKTFYCIGKSIIEELTWAKNFLFEGIFTAFSVCSAEVTSKLIQLKEQERLVELES